MESQEQYYYLQVPTRTRLVSQPVDFLPVQQLLEDEAACKEMWDMLTANFRTRSKFLSTWPHVRFVALHRQAGQAAGFLLVSTGINWQIDYVTVGNEFRGQGIAEALVNETLNQALARGVPYVMLTSNESLRGLYEGRCGFKVVSSNQAAAAGCGDSLTG